jgi:plastocyanin
VSAVAGRPGWSRAVTPRGTFELQFPRAQETGNAPDYLIVSSGQDWDADGLQGDAPDTLVVPIGARVRWHRSAGLHTITDGRGADDPKAGSHFDYLLDSVHPDFDSTFSAPDTVNFFCSFHEPFMRGVLIVSANASVPPTPLPAALDFTRSPWPNPTHGAITFTLGLPAEARITVEILDLAGRRVAELHRGVLGPGEHSFRWRDTDANGARRPPGTYVVRITDGQRVTSRPFSLIH